MKKKRNIMSRRKFLKRLSAFLAMSGFAGILRPSRAVADSEVKMKSGNRNLPCSNCPDCTARFCRYAEKQAGVQ